MSELLARTLGEEVAIETVLAAGLWRTQADPNQLENALLNLAVNARDAMPGGGRLTIETANVHLDDAYAEAQVEVASGQYVNVRRDGHGHGHGARGARAGVRAVLHDEAGGAGHGAGPGAGVGFAKQSGGHVSIYSEPGEGTTVKLYLPRQMGPTLPPPTPDLVALPEDGGRGRGETVLVVEDEAAVRAFTVEVLEGLGYRVLAAEDAASGLALLARVPGVSLLLTDVVLAGGVNGRQLADEAVQRDPGCGCCT